jgi:hypothetical protein
VVFLRIWGPGSEAPSAVPQAHTNKISGQGWRAPQCDRTFGAGNLQSHGVSAEVDRRGAEYVDSQFVGQHRQVTMATNMERYKKDLDSLIKQAAAIEASLVYEADPQPYVDGLKERATQSPAIAKSLGASPSDLQDLDEKIQKYLDSLPKFRDAYQRWYSESIAVIRQILPDRLSDFVRHYEKPKQRKEITNENYRMEDFLQGLSITVGTSIKVARTSAIPHFQQQWAILKACRARFESSLFEIRQLVQADLLDSELDAARELSKHRFTRAAGAMAGVVLEKHLAEVCDSHSIKVTKAKPTINDLNEALKSADVIEVPTWRFIQHLADIRNLCDHNKEMEPSQEQVEEMIAGVGKISKTVF